jgi:DnaK suppressor protein
MVKKTSQKTHLSAEFLKKAEERLHAEEKRLKEKVAKLAEYDPFLVPGRDVGNAEMMDEAEEGIGHERVESERAAIRKLLEETQRALAQLKAGKYGLCDKCGAKIDRARLEIYPQAYYCVECEKTLGEGE